MRALPLRSHSYHTPIYKLLITNAAPAIISIPSANPASINGSSITLL